MRVSSACSAGGGNAPPPPPIAGRIYCCSQILSPWLGDIVDSGIGLSHRPARLQYAGEPVQQPYAEVDYIPQSETKNLACVIPILLLSKCLSMSEYVASVLCVHHHLH
jgi:hypothetical protein